MARELDLFVDHMLDDVVQHWMREQDIDPAWPDVQCQQPWILTGHMPDCARYASAVGRGVPPGQLGWFRGRCREQQYVRNRCLGRIQRDARGRLHRVPRNQWPPAAAAAAARDVRRGVRIIPSMIRSPIVDAIQGPLGPRGSGVPAGTQPGEEHKSMWVARYVDPVTGQIDRQALRNRVLREANQVARQQQWSRRAAPPGSRHEVRPGMPRDHELVYSLDGLQGLPPQAVRGVRSLIQHTAARQGIRAHILDMDD